MSGKRGLLKKIGVCPFCGKTIFTVSGCVGISGNVNTCHCGSSVTSTHDSTQTTILNQKREDKNND